MNIWAFGISAGVDFNTTPASVFQTEMDQLEGCASVCDAAGQLLFYTDGTRVYDRNHNLMPNSPIAPINISNYTATFSTSQASVIVSRPQAPSQYYVFSLECRENPTGRLYYSVVDMSLNAGLGDIPPSQKQIQLDSNLSEKMIAMPGRQCNAWLIVKDLSANVFKSYNITPAGIQSMPVLSDHGMVITGSALGVMKASPDKQKIAVANGVALQLYDFNNVSGELTNRLTIDTVLNYTDTMAFFYGACFSPDNSKLYASYVIYLSQSSNTTGRIYQYDMSLPTPAAIIASKTNVYQTTSGQSFVGDLRVAPDSKMYFVRDGASSLNAIDFPNLAGTACQVAPNILALGNLRRSRLGLPNDVVVLPASDTFFSRRDTAVCGSATLSAPGGGYNYHWSTGDEGQSIPVTQSGTYVVSYNNACDYRIDTIMLNFFTAPEMGGYYYSCPARGDGKVWSVPQAADATTYTYTWIDDAGTIISTRQSKQGDTLCGLNAGNYTVHIQNPYGCDTLLAFTIQELPVPVAAFTGDTVVCVGVPLQLASGSAAPAVTWHFGDGIISTLENTEHIYARPGAYTISLVAENIEHCTDTAIQLIHVKDFDLRLTASEYEVDKGRMITLTTAAVDAYQVIAWQPAELFADQSALSQSLAMDSSTSFTVYGQTDYGCLDSAKIVISVIPVIFLPSGFSPNGDGRNDYFRPHWFGDDVIVKVFAVYDRWGNKVWVGYGQTAITGWDGSYAGTPAAAGVYFYAIEFVSTTGRAISRKGDITLVR